MGLKEDLTEIKKEVQGKDIYVINKDRLKNLSFLLKMTILGDFFS